MGRQKENMHYIYKTTCNVTGRYYVGMHSTSNLEDGYLGSGKRLRYSISKYGKENHIKEILEYCDSREVLVLREIEIVNSDFILDDMCMNLCVGGEGGHGSKFLTKEQLKKGGRNANKIFQEKIKNNPAFKEEISNKLTKKLQNSYFNGERKGFSGTNFTNRNHSEETKKLMSETSKGKGTGETNSQFGTCWITNGTINKKIYKGDYFDENWRLGRVITLNKLL